MADAIIGIDLGTTNSEVAAFVDGKVRVLPADEPILPSVVGVTPEGKLLVGVPARNQLLVYPERTVKSIKRKMGTDERATLGERTLTPPEVSAVILRALKERAEAALGEPVRRAIITVPAFFSDAQRQATKDAGAIAGLEVVRILNEPTAAALAYGEDREGVKTVLVYDLGGGTFDVSLVQASREMTEVLASHGDTRLGGDDFDQLLFDHVHGRWMAEGGPDLRPDGRASARLLRAVEEAKKALSFEPHARIREEHLASVNGVSRHLDLEVSRDAYEELITPLLEKTLDSVHEALTRAGKRPDQIEEILLVGGATRTPLVSDLLTNRTGLVPRQDLHPDLCVALGAGVLAARLSGHDVERVLVDVSPYSFGIAYFDAYEDEPDCYRPILHRSSPLPLSRTEAYATVHDDQVNCDIDVYQGEDPYAPNNLLVGRFTVEGLSKAPAGNEILCRMDLDVDGLLRVTAVEKKTGLAKSIAIEKATTALTPEEIRRKRFDLLELSGDEEEHEHDDDGDEEDELEVEPGPPAAPDATAAVPTDVAPLLERSRALLPRMSPDDREDAIALHERIEQALLEDDRPALLAAQAELVDLLFFIEENG